MLVVFFTLFALCVSALDWSLKLHGPFSIDGIGRVEVTPVTGDSNWGAGTVCSSGITQVDAAALCNLLGFTDAAAPLPFIIGNGVGVIYWSDFHCRADAQAISECSFVESSAFQKINNCSHLDDLGLSCLSSTSSMQSLIFNASVPIDFETLDFVSKLRTIIPVFDEQIHVVVEPDPQNTKWAHATISFSTANGMTISPAAASSIFRSLPPHILVGLSIYNLLDNSEGSMQQEEISHNINTFDFKLVGGSGTSFGRAEVRPGSSQVPFGTVCGDKFGIKEAAAFCRTLGFSGATTEQVLAIPYFGGGSGRIVMSMVSCPPLASVTIQDGCEFNLISPHSRAWDNSCTHSMDVGVHCAAGESTDQNVTFFLFTPPTTSGASLIEAIHTIANVNSSRIMIKQLNTLPRAIFELMFVEREGIPAEGTRWISKGALQEFLGNINAEGLLNLFGVELLLQNVTILPTIRPSVIPNITIKPSLVVHFVALVNATDFSDLAFQQAIGGYLGIPFRCVEIEVSQLSGKRIMRVIFHLENVPVAHDVFALMEELKALARKPHGPASLGLISLRFVGQENEEISEKTKRTVAIVVFVLVGLFAALLFALRTIRLQSMKHEAQGSEAELDFEDDYLAKAPLKKNVD